VIPAFLSFALITVAVHEPECPKEPRRVRMPLSRSELRHLTATYWWVVGVAAVFTLARFSEAFLVLRAQSIGVPLMLVPAVLVITNIAAVSAYPVGVLSDRMDRVTVLTRVTIDPAVPNSESLDNEIARLRGLDVGGRLTENSERASYSPCDRWGQWEELAMKTTILAYVIALGGVALIVLGLWRLYILITERVAELRLRDYIPTIQTIAVGFGLIGLAQALRLLLVIFGSTDASLRALLA
jgi:hypothetical protein